jgi:hypothetical protein
MFEKIIQHFSTLEQSIGTYGFFSWWTAHFLDNRRKYPTRKNEL